MMYALTCPVPLSPNRLKSKGLCLDTRWRVDAVILLKKDDSSLMWAIVWQSPFLSLFLFSSLDLNQERGVPYDMSLGSGYALPAESPESLC